MVKQKQRHGCLSSSLILMIIANSATALIYLLWSDTIKQAYPAAPGWAFPVLVVFCIFNLVCVIALFKWKKWGFWGFLVSSIVALIVNLSIGLGFGQSLLGLMGIVLLYAVLQIGKEKKGWSQME
jgi:hypothetical protein